MAVWRPMTEADFPGVMRIADEIHHALPETEAILRERLALFPQGCLVLVEGSDIGGYAMSFPIRHGRPPALNTPLGEIPADADQYYLHDLAILPPLRGRGLAATCIARILALAAAQGYATTCLVSVYGTVPFWRRFGFISVPVDEVLEEKLRGYGPDATYLARENPRLE